MNSDKLAPFAGQKYLSLESYRKTGQPVRTPVWFAEEAGVFYFYTEAESFKIKRIRNNTHVRVAPCDVRGNIKGAGGEGGEGGEWIDGTAQILDADGERHTHQLLNRKYGLIKRAMDVLAKLRGHGRASVAIHFD